MDSAVSLPWKYTQTVQMSMQCCTQVLSSADILIQTFLGALDICKYHYSSWHSSWIFKIIISLFLLCRTLHLHKVENAVSEKKAKDFLKDHCHLEIGKRILAYISLKLLCVVWTRKKKLQRTFKSWQRVSLHHLIPLCLLFFFVCFFEKNASQLLQPFDYINVSIVCLLAYYF